MILLDGKTVAASIRAETSLEVEKLSGRAGRRPGLAVILVGDDAPSNTYVRNKERACAETGIRSETLRLPARTSQDEVVNRIRILNKRPDIDGILLQLPLPGHVDSRPCFECIDPAKDVDGFHPVNMGRLLQNIPGLRPCTPSGVMELLKRYGLNPAGKRAVVAGRSNIVGRPLSVMLSAKSAWGNATVTLCHSATSGVAALFREADFLFLAMGRPGFVRGEMVKKGTVVVDIGISVTENGLRGDADFASVSEMASALTPVPGGIGPMTIAMLLRNTVQAFAARL
ncbi:MAG: bifunctional methylenetetrahydrofolate dehydrogenase/methenyltetrahydrofolate cyclohydrolase FolD [Desulfovibrio sp.]|nr:bifunctional methylenetetrahydrofolate dehydrogenase/methenyltetrahydrofolate cyclohydrolase FolD [Desulfovibrio sp.]